MPFSLCPKFHQKEEEEKEAYDLDPCTKFVFINTSESALTPYWNKLKFFSRMPTLVKVQEIDKIDFKLKEIRGATSSNQLPP